MWGFPFSWIKKTGFSQHWGGGKYRALLVNHVKSGSPLKQTRSPRTPQDAKGQGSARLSPQLVPRTRRGGQSGRAAEKQPKATTRPQPSESGSGAKSKRARARGRWEDGARKASDLFSASAKQSPPTTPDAKAKPPTPSSQLPPPL